MGNSVRAPSLKLYHRFRREPRLIRLARISLRFRQCLMAKYRHYLVGGTPCLSEPPASGLAKAMRLTIERETGGSDRIADPLTETVNRKRPTIFSVDDRRMVALGGSQNRDQVAVERNRELASGFLLRNSNLSIVHIGPSHAVHVAPTLASVKHESESKPLLCADRPMVLKCRYFGVCP